MAHEIISDGRTVWVNGSDGICLARFSRFGIDVHNDAFGQMAGGYPEMTWIGTAQALASALGFCPSTA
jgi:hypothetical protein